ncbi:hypothetical protein RYX36_021780 [Vicia faba]
MLVLSTQSLLIAAGLRPTPAQATAVSWILKDGMQHVGKIICSNWGARMDSEPKRWRLLADVLYDLGMGLEVLSPLCPHLFLEMAGLGNFAKGMAVVAARATRLPIYSSFAKEGNFSNQHKHQTPFIPSIFRFCFFHQCSSITTHSANPPSNANASTL